MKKYKKEGLEVKSKLPVISTDPNIEKLIIKKIYQNFRVKQILLVIISK